MPLTGSMVLLPLLLTLLQYVSLLCDCVPQAALQDVDYHGLAQEYFPEEWQRELMALTALSQLEDLDLLSLETRNETRAWKRFRANGISEALVNMVRVGGFQMYNELSEADMVSMWGLTNSIRAFYSEPMYEEFKDAAQGQEFVQADWGYSLGIRSAYILAAKWAIKLKGKVAFYDKPFYGVEETVAALIRLRDPTGFFQGNQSEGESLLRRKLIFGGQPTCQREARIAIAFDAHYYNSYDMPRVNTFLDDIRRFNPRAEITIRGTSLLSGGFNEGYHMQEIPSLEADPFAKPFEILDLVEKSIGDISFSELASEDLRPRVLIIISKLKDRTVNIPRATELSKEMRRIGIEPFYFTVESADVQYNDGDLLPLLNNQTYRGISSGTDNAETMKMIVHRLVRLICQAPALIPYNEWKVFRTFPQTFNNIYDRMYFRYDKPSGKDMTRFVSFACVSLDAPCEFSFYVHPQRHVNEYFYDEGVTDRIVPPQWTLWEHVDVPSRESDAIQVVLIAKSRSAIAVQMFHSATVPDMRHLPIIS